MALIAECEICTVWHSVCQPGEGCVKQGGHVKSGVSGREVLIGMKALRHSTFCIMLEFNTASPIFPCYPNVYPILSSIETKI